MENYKVILVDDEEEVIDAIKSRILWEQLGLQIVGSATNGVKALELVEKLQPDIVITDIKMPYMNGLELSRRLNDEYKNVHIIIFTGFDEFDYAKEPGCELLNSNRVSNDKPSVSIITPYYNAGKHFEQTFNCVMNQTFPWFEWIIVDDGSTDKPSLDTLERLSKQDTRIRVLHQSNQRQAAARNAAIKHSTTDIIIPLDADDLISPPFIEELYFALQKNPMRHGHIQIVLALVHRTTFGNSLFRLPV